MKKVLSAGFAVLSFLAGVLVIFTKKSQAPFKTALVLEVGLEQLDNMANEGGSILFHDVNVKGTIRVQLREADRPE